VIPLFVLVSIAPQPQPDGTTVLAEVELDGSRQPLRWLPLLHQGEGVGSGPPFGTIPGPDGRPLSQYDHYPTCPSPDGNALLQAHGRTWLLTHQECSPAVIFRTRLAPDGAGGLRAVDSLPLDRPALAPLNQLCAADVTPWGSMLGGEEYEPDAALLVDGVIDSTPAGKADGRPYSDWSRFSDYRRAQPGASPYGVGFMQETRIVDADGTAATVKHPAMGRMSHELGRVMPDQRTVYLSDDNSYGMLAMFVADRAGDLSAGQLYAARWDQDAKGTGATLRWVPLGHATDTEVGAAISEGIGFADLFDRAPATADGCPGGSTWHRAPQGIDECLRPQEGQQALASRLETRRAAALAGATTELNKEEGIAVDTAGRRLFVAFTRVGAGMLAEDPPRPERDHVRLPENPCGAVYGFSLVQGVADTAGARIDSPWVATTGDVVVSGQPGAAGRCAADAPKNPDNLDFIDEAGVLLIAEDTDRAPNRLWALQGERLLPLFAAPGTGSPLAEVSGLSWAPDINGFGWIALSLQHPGDDPAVVGLLGPFPQRTAPASGGPTD